MCTLSKSATPLCCLPSFVRCTSPREITTGSYTRRPGPFVYLLTASDAFQHPWRVGKETSGDPSPPANTAGVHGLGRDNLRGSLAGVPHHRAHPPRPRGLRAAGSRPGAACGHSQEVLHGDADDGALHEGPGWPRQSRRRVRVLPLARHLGGGISGESPLGSLGVRGRSPPARSRHPGFLRVPRRLPFPASRRPGSRAN